MLKKLFLSLAVVSALAGCSSVPMADAPQDQAAKTFKADAAKSGIYIYRNELLGGAVKMDVSIDGQPVGATKAKTYLFKQVEPGKHTIVSEAENTSVLARDQARHAVLHLAGSEDGRHVRPQQAAAGGGR